MKKLNILRIFSGLAIGLAVLWTLALAIPLPPEINPANASRILFLMTISSVLLLLGVIGMFGSSQFREVSGSLFFCVFCHLILWGAQDNLKAVAASFALGGVLLNGIPIYRNS